jgi:hypothetical protein
VVATFFATVVAVPRTALLVVPVSELVPAVDPEPLAAKLAICLNEFCSAV